MTDCASFYGFYTLFWEGQEEELCGVKMEGDIDKDGGCTQKSVLQFNAALWCPFSFSMSSFYDFIASVNWIEGGGTHDRYRDGLRLKTQGPAPQDGPVWLCPEGNRYDVHEQYQFNIIGKKRQNQSTLDNIKIPRIS